MGKAEFRETSGSAAPDMESEEYQLVDISAATMRSEGGLVVLDRGAKIVRLFDADGNFVRTLGGPGSGPGEFQNPIQVLVTPGDSVVVWDDALLRVTRDDHLLGLYLDELEVEYLHVYSIQKPSGAEIGQAPS